MMKTKNLVLLGIALAVLLGINLMQKSGHKKATSQSSVAEIIADGFVPADLSRITIGYGAETEVVVLSNNPTGWTVDSAWFATANMARIETLVRNISGLTGEYRSDSAEVLADYGLGADGAVRVRAYNPAGDLVIALDVGHKPERYPGNFVRQPDSDKVYVSQKNLLAEVGMYDGPEMPKSRYFLELQALQEDRLEVDRMAITTDGERLEFVKDFAVEAATEGEAEGVPVLDRNTWEWSLEGVAEGGAEAGLAKTKVDAVLNSLVAVRATDLVDPKADLAGYGLAEPSRRAALQMQDGREIVMTFGHDREAVADAPAGTYMQLGGDDTVWVVTEYAIKNIFKGLDELKPE